MVCPACQADNYEGSKVCKECGTALALHCPSCGAGHEPGQRFCSECGTALAAADEQLGAATRELRAIDAPFVLAQVLLEHAELLHAEGRDEAAAPLLGEATEIFTRLRPTPYLQRAQALGAGVAA